MGSGTLAIVIFLGLLSLVTAGPGIQKRSFAVQQATGSEFARRDGPRELAKAYRKYRIAIPQGLKDHLAAQDAKRKRDVEGPKVFHPIRRENPNTGLMGSVAGRIGLAGTMRSSSRLASRQQGNTTKQVGSVPAIPEKNDVEYLSPVKIGGQNVVLDFDTGSSDLWVLSNAIPGASGGNRKTFDQTKSRTFKPMQGATFQISYGDGSAAAGGVGMDMIDVGGAMTLQAIEVADKVTSSFLEDQNNSGLMGLAFSNLNTVKPQKQKTFFENIKASLPMPLFTADLRKGSAGTYEFGRIDSSKFTGDLTWIPVNTTMGFWQFSSTSFAVGDGPRQEATPGGQAIADTGTTLIIADPKTCTNYYGQVAGAVMNQTVGGFTVPCNQTLPDLKLDMNGIYMATVKGSDINFAPIEEGGTSPRLEQRRDAWAGALLMPL